MKGKPATFSCTADGNPTPAYTWLKDGKLVSSSPTFFIRNVSYADAGTYACVANNTIEAGWRTDNASVAVKVEGISRCLIRYGTQGIVCACVSVLQVLQGIAIY